MLLHQMEPLKLFYPNNYFRNASVLGLKKDFHWGLCGKRMAIPGTSSYLLKVSSNARFIGSQSGKTFRLSRKPKLLVLQNLKKKDVSKTMKTIRDLHLDGAVIHSRRKMVGLPWCSSVDFIFLPGFLQEVTFPERCPLIRFVKRYNDQLRMSYPQIPTCSDLESLLKEKGLNQTCRYLLKALDQ